MIIVRPSASTLFSFGLFTLAGALALALNVLELLRNPSPRWYTYAVVVALSPVLIYVVLRIFIRYRSISFGDNRIRIRYPVLGRQRGYRLDQVTGWREDAVKTGKTRTYRELRIRFTDGHQLQMGRQEYQNYDRALAYLQQKLGRKRAGLSPR